MKNCKRLRIAGFLLIFVLVFSACTGNRRTQPTDTTQSALINGDDQWLYSAVDAVTNNPAEKEALIAFLRDILPHDGIPWFDEADFEYHGADFAYEAAGNYLFIYMEEYGGSGSSYQHFITFLVDTASRRLIHPTELFVNLSDPEFQGLILEYFHILHGEDIDSINLDLVLAYVPEMTIEIFYDNTGVGMRWGEGFISANYFGHWDIVLPYSRVQNFLTELGRDIFR